MMISRTWLSATACVLVALATASCSGGGDQSEDALNESSEGELRASSIKSIQTSRSAGFGPMLPEGRCRAGAAQYSLDFESKLLTSNVCSSGRARTLARHLSREEMAQVRRQIAGVKTTSRPESCPADVPVTSLTIHRAQSSIDYVEARSACGGGRTPVSDLRPLLDTLLELATGVAEPDLGLI